MIDALECYYCNDEEGYYCPQPFPTKSIFSSNTKYNEQMKNIAVSSSNKPGMESITTCFKTDQYSNNYKYQNTFRGAIKSSMNNSLICQTDYRLSQNPNYPGWEKTYCCYHNRCNQAETIIKDNIFIRFVFIQIVLTNI